MNGAAQGLGWDAATITTAILAGLAALAGVAGIFMSWVMQRDQQKWQESQEGRRRSWESEQERQRRSWQETQLVRTRWDSHKQAIYTTFLSLADQLYAITGELGDVRRNLAEDLANHMAMVEDHVMETESVRLNAMAESERRDYFRALYDEQLAWYKERRTSLSSTEAEVSGALQRAAAELHLVVPEDMRTLIDLLTAQSRQGIYGDRHNKKNERTLTRAQFVGAVRADLQVQTNASGPDTQPVQDE